MRIRLCYWIFQPIRISYFHIVEIFFKFYVFCVTGNLQQNISFDKVKNNCHLRSDPGDNYLTYIIGHTPRIGDLTYYNEQN